MSNSLFDNAFGILGLLPNSTQKEISKRGKDIPKYLKIGDTPQYDFDYGLFYKKRNENNVKDAVNRLSNIQDLILNYFFRIYPQTESDMVFYKKIEECFYKNKDDFDAFYELVGEKSYSSFLQLKNLIVIKMLFLKNKMEKTQLRKLTESVIKNIQDLFANDKYWNDFIKFYKTDDDFGISDDILKDVRTNIIQEFAKVFSDIADVQKDAYVIKRYIESCETNGNLLTSLNYISEVYQKLSDNDDCLNDFAKDVKLVNNKKLATLLTDIQDNLNELIDLNLYDEVDSINIRDRIAQSLRLLALSYNESEKLEISQGLLSIATQICGSYTIKNEMVQQQEYVNHIMDLQENGIFIVKLGKSIYTFYFDRLTIDTLNIPYSNLEGIGFKYSKQETLLGGQSWFEFKVKTNGRIIERSEGTPIWGKAYKLEEKIQVLFTAIDKLIAPLLVERYVQLIASGKKVSIGSVKFDKQGIHVPRAFWGEKHVYWRDIKYYPKLEQGQMTIWDKNGRNFYTAPISDINVFLFDMLIRTCCERKVYL